MRKKHTKTNAMRILDSQKMPYQELHYEVDDGLIDGHSVYKKLEMDPTEFFKTLVAVGKDKQHFVFVIPVLAELDLKKAAKACGEKNVALVAVKELLSLTGYIRGGCSPVGMKKLFPTYFDSQILKIDTIFVSGGKQGFLIGLSPRNILQATNGVAADLIRIEN